MTFAIDQFKSVSPSQKATSLQIPSFHPPNKVRKDIPFFFFTTLKEYTASPGKTVNINVQSGYNNF